MTDSPDTPNLHEAIASLGFLLGTWTGAGHGEYPTIESFDYDETVTFAHVGKPFLAYQQRTVGRPGGAPLHAETGYLRGVAPGRIEFVLAHPSGVVEIQVGTFTPTATGGEFQLASQHVATTPSAKRVDAVDRWIEVDGDVLRYRLGMAAVGEPMTHHLAAELHRNA